MLNNSYFIYFLHNPIRLFQGVNNVSVMKDILVCPRKLCFVVFPTLYSRSNSLIYFLKSLLLVLMQVFTFCKCSKKNRVYKVKRSY
jgi:hypothetical protein